MLIDRLVEQHRPTPPHRLPRRIAVSTLLGAAIILALVVTWGIRPNIAASSATLRFWVKLGFGAGFAITGFTGLLALFRPERPAPRRLWFAAIPIAVIAAAAFNEIATVSDAELTALWLGKSALACPFAIVALSAFPSYALIQAGRRSAPTRLRLTGGVIGLTSSGLAAMLYALHCPENGMTFVATWYSVGVMLATLVGIICGPRLLRW